MFSKYKLLFSGLVLAAIAFALLAYNYLYANNVAIDSYELKIKSGSSYLNVLNELEQAHVLKSKVTFDQVAALMKYKRIKSHQEGIL